MWINQLALMDFRSYARLELSLEPGVTALIGPNGQGKTNLVEAIGYVATLGSHRVTTDGPLVRTGADQAIVRTLLQEDGRSTLIELEINPGRANRARVNRAPVPRAREVAGLLRTVLFAPEDLAIVKGDPDGRRRLLDDLLVARAPRFAGVRADYERVVRQRTALLKSAAAARRGAADLRTLDAWDAHLAHHGAELLAARLDLVESLRARLRVAYAAITGTTVPTSVPAMLIAGEPSVNVGLADDGVSADARVAAGELAAVARAHSDSPGPIGIDYRGSLPAEVPLVADPQLLKAALLAELARLRGQEIERGLCLVGPHRDDVLLRLGDRPTKGYASQGECWSIAIALRLAAYDLLRCDGGEPVLILDDVFAELDTSRRQRLASYVAGCEQVLVTAAVADDVPVELNGARVDVANGVATRVY